MSSAQKELAKRIAELRRRHFGARGKADFASRLGISLDEYERYERGAVPLGQLMVRMCELTGEDLQWLLTGVGSRGTVVISGMRHRHQDFLTRLADALEADPSLAGPIESFVDLLLRSKEQRAKLNEPLALQGSDGGGLIPIFDADSAPEDLPKAGESSDQPALVALANAVRLQDQSAWVLAEPTVEEKSGESRTVNAIVLAGDNNESQQFVDSKDLVTAFPGIFGVRIADDDMTPMFAEADVALVVPTNEARIGRPVLVKPQDEPAKCRIWLGANEGEIALGRLNDQADERISRTRVTWALEVLYRLAPAA